MKKKNKTDMSVMESYRAMSNSEKIKYLKNPEHFPDNHPERLHIDAIISKLERAKNQD